MSNDFVHMEENDVEELSPKGIGGWLILVIIGYGIGIFKSLLLVLQLGYHLLNGEVKMSILSQGFNEQSILMMIYYEWVGNMLLLALMIICLVLLFSKKKLFPKFAIWVKVGVVLFILSDFLLAYFLEIQIHSSEKGTLIGSVLHAIIWITYFIKSERVKNTFMY